MHHRRAASQWCPTARVVDDPNLARTVMIHDGGGHHNFMNYYGSARAQQWRFAPTHSTAVLVTETSLSGES
jgi:hypothetical protein